MKKLVLKRVDETTWQVLNYDIDNDLLSYTGLAYTFIPSPIYGDMLGYIIEHRDSLDYGRVLFYKMNAIQHCATAEYPFFYYDLVDLDFNACQLWDTLAAGKCNDLELADAQAKWSQLYTPAQPIVLLTWDQWQELQMVGFHANIMQHRADFLEKHRVTMASSNIRSQNMKPGFLMKRKFKNQPAISAAVLVQTPKSVTPSYASIVKKTSSDIKAKPSKIKPDANATEKEQLAAALRAVAVFEANEAKEAAKEQLEQKSALKAVAELEASEAAAKERQEHEAALKAVAEFEAQESADQETTVHNVKKNAEIDAIINQAQEEQEANIIHSFHTLLETAKSASATKFKEHVRSLATYMQQHFKPLFAEINSASIPVQICWQLLLLHGAQKSRVRQQDSILKALILKMRQTDENASEFDAIVIDNRLLDVIASARKKFTTKELEQFTAISDSLRKRRIARDRDKQQQNAESQDNGDLVVGDPRQENNRNADDFIREYNTTESKSKWMGSLKLRQDELPEFEKFIANVDLSAEELLAFFKLKKISSEILIMLLQKVLDVEDADFYGLFNKLLQPEEFQHVLKTLKENEALNSEMAQKFKHAIAVKWQEIAAGVTEHHNRGLKVIKDKCNMVLGNHVAVSGKTMLMVVLQHYDSENLAELEYLAENSGQIIRQRDHHGDDAFSHWAFIYHKQTLIKAVNPRFIRILNPMFGALVRNIRSAAPSATIKDYSEATIDDSRHNFLFPLIRDENIIPEHLINILDAAFNASQELFVALVFTKDSRERNIYTLMEREYYKFAPVLNHINSRLKQLSPRVIKQVDDEIEKPFESTDTRNYFCTLASTFDLDDPRQSKKVMDVFVGRLKALYGLGIPQRTRLSYLFHTLIGIIYESCRHGLPTTVALQKSLRFSKLVQIGVEGGEIYPKAALLPFVMMSVLSSPDSLPTIGYGLIMVIKECLINIDSPQKVSSELNYFGERNGDNILYDMLVICCRIQEIIVNGLPPNVRNADAPPNFTYLLGECEALFKPIIDAGADVSRTSKNGINVTQFAIRYFQGTGRNISFKTLKAFIEAMPQKTAQQQVKSQLLIHSDTTKDKMLETYFKQKGWEFRWASEVPGARLLRPSNSAKPRLKAADKT